MTDILFETNIINRVDYGILDGSK